MKKLFRKIFFNGEYKTKFDVCGYKFTIYSSLELDSDTINYIKSDIFNSGLIPFDYSTMLKFKSAVEYKHVLDKNDPRITSIIPIPDLNLGELKK